MTDLYKDVITIYNDIAADSVNPRRFFRHVLQKCNIQSGYIESTAENTIQAISNGLTVITKDVALYCTPSVYLELPEDEKENYYTVQIDDFVIFGEVDDIVTTSREFQNLQDKYKGRGFSVSSTNAYIYGMATDNVSISHS